MLVVAGALPVPLLHMTSGSVNGNPMLCDDTVGPVRQCAGDKDVETVLPPLQDVVSAPPYNDAGPFIRQFLNEKLYS